MNIAIIPARGGSKRIPRKNIKQFMGKPMIAYPIEACLKSSIFDEVMVSTDCPDIAYIAEKYGANVPFMRSQVNSNDFSTTMDVLEEVVNTYESKGKFFDIVSCIYPCSPFLTSDILTKAYDKMLRTGCNSLVPVVRFSYPIQRALCINNSDELEFREPTYINMRSQDLQPMFHDAGMFYFAQKDIIVKDKTFIGTKTAYYELEESSVQDIDTASDWKLAEIKFIMQCENEVRE